MAHPIDDAVAEKTRLSLDALMRQMATTEEWNDALSLVLLGSCKLLQQAYGDEYLRLFFLRGLDSLGNHQPVTLH